MAKLTTTQIDALKDKGYITVTEPAAALANKSVDELKDKEYITVTEPSADIESIVTVPTPAPEPEG